MLTQYPGCPYASINMAVPTGESQPSSGEAISPFFAAVQELDLSTQGYLDACGVYAGRPNAKNEDFLDTTANWHIAASRAYLLALADDMTVPAFQDAAIRFLMEQDAERVNALNDLLGRPDALGMRDAKPVIDDPDIIPPDDETLKRNIGLAIADIHSKGVGVDTQFFVEDVSDGPAAQRLERLEKLKKHALDIGKAALGGAIGSALALWAARRRS